MSQQKQWRSAKLLISVSTIAILVTVLLGLATHRTSRRYESDAFVLMQPFTNAVLGSDFDRHMRKTFSGIGRLYFQQSGMVMRRPGKTTTNSQVVIQITASGDTADDAIKTANEIASQFCKKVAGIFTNATVSILNPAVGASDTRPRTWWSSFNLGTRKDFEPTRISGTVHFVNANVLLSPDNEWEQHYIAGISCPPSLIRRGARTDQFLSVSLLGMTQTNIEAAAHARFESRTTTTLNIDSLQKDSFKAENGLSFVRVSYCQNDNSRGRLLRSRHCEYFTTNGVGRIVRIDHMVIPADTTNDVHQMIVRTLRLK